MGNFKIKKHLCDNCNKKQLLNRKAYPPFYKCLHCGYETTKRRHKRRFRRLCIDCDKMFEPGETQKRPKKCKKCILKMIRKRETKRNKQGQWEK